MTVRHAASSVRPLPQVDVAIVTALQSELDPVLALLGGRKAWGEPHTVDGVSHFVAEFPSTHGALRVVAATATAPGGDFTGAAVGRAVQFQPTLLVMAGCCAGRGDKTLLGDLIVPEWSFDPHEGKQTSQGLQPAGATTPPLSRKPLMWAEEFAHDPAWARTIQTPHPEHVVTTMLCRLSNHRARHGQTAVVPSNEDERLVLEWLRREKLIDDAGAITAAGAEWLQQRSTRAGDRRRPKRIARIPAVHIAPAVQWAAVEARPGAFDDALQRARKVAMGDNESNSFFRAAREHEVVALVAKAVVDYADGEKNDLYHRYSKEVSARWLFAFLTTYADRIRGLPTRFGPAGPSHAAPGPAPPAEPTADQIRAYLVSLQQSLAANRLLERFGRQIDALRLPLQAVPFVPAPDPELLQRRERLRFEADPDEATLRTVYARRGEDAEQDKEQQRQARPEPLDDLAEQLSCVVVLGDPGSGKTEWLRWRARLAAGHCLEALERGATPADLEAPIFARLDAVARQLARSDEQLLGALEKAGCAPGAMAGLGLAERLAAVLVLVVETDDPGARPLRPWLWRRLTGPASPASASLRVYLDAWDEVREGRDILLQSLGAFIAAARATLVVSSRIVGYEPGGLPVDGAHVATRRTLQVQPFAWDQTVTFVERFFDREPATRDEMRAQLQALPAVAGMAQNPLVATLICAAFAPGRDSYQPLRLPARRVEIYERVLRRLVEDWAITEKRVALTSDQVEGVLDLVAALAFQIFPAEVATTPQINRCVHEYLGARPEFDSLRGLVQRDGVSLQRLLSEIGVLVPSGRAVDGAEQFIFLHLTFQEYLAARHLARLVNEQDGDWEAVELRRRGAPALSVHQLIARRAWLPEWQELVVLFAGRLDHPEPLLQLLAAPPPDDPDDLFRHHLALATLCLAELAPAQQTRHAALAQQAGGALVTTWKDHAQENTVATVRHIERAMRAAIGTNSTVSAVIAAQLARLCADANPNVRQAAARAVGALGGAAAGESTLLAGLATLLRDPAWSVRQAAARAVGALGGAAGGEPALLAGLAALLRDPDASVRPSVRRAAADAVRALGGAAAGESTLLAGLATLLRDPDASVRQAAADAVRAVQRSLRLFAGDDGVRGVVLDSWRRP